MVHGLPRAFLGLRARTDEPLARFVLGRTSAADRLRLIEEVRAAGPLMRTPVVFATADHEICRNVLRDKNFGVADPTQPALPGPLPAFARRLNPGLPSPVEPPAMLMTDPPVHARYRTLVARSFTPRSIAHLDTRIGEVTAELLDDLQARRHVDLINDYAAQLPAAIITEMLGVPGELRTQILGWGNTVAALLDIGIGWRAYRAAMTDLVAADDYLTGHFRRLHTGGGDDTPFSDMALEGGLTERELTANAALLIGAGVETTVNLIGNGIAALLDHPDQLALLHDDPELWPAAIEEILRYDSPVQMTARAALCDTEIAGIPIPQSTTIVLLLGGANRDPQVFEKPDRFDITRPNARDHLAFATGVHVCLGAALARNEGVTALRELFTRFPDLSLDAPPERRSLVNLNGYRRMSATVTPRMSAPTLPH